MNNTIKLSQSYNNGRCDNKGLFNLIENIETEFNSDYTSVLNILKKILFD